MDWVMGAALVAAGAAVGVVIAMWASAAGRTTAYMEGYRHGRADGWAETGDEDGYRLDPVDRGL